MAAPSNTSGSLAVQVKASKAAVGSLEHAEALIRPLFDAALYASEYADVMGEPAALLRHFCRHGWREGRIPNRAFDTATYLLTHPDVDAHGINPYYHYLLTGRDEGRDVSPAFVPSEIAERAFGRPVGDWMALLRPQLDVAFYLAALGFDPSASFDPVAHYAYRGWLEGRDPNPRFCVRDALAANPALWAARLNPLLHALLVPPPKPAEFGTLRSTRFSMEQLATGEAAPNTPAKPAPAPSFGDAVQQHVADHLDRAFYLHTYPDVRNHGADPVVHYCSVGWSEGRNPTATFNTAYYLATNPDVAAQGLNPFWHYLVIGQAEGRTSQRPGGYRRQAIEAARSPDAPINGNPRPELTSVLSRAQLHAMLRPAVQTASGLALSIGHDRYVSVTGGLQLFLCAEQAKFGRQGVAYLNLSPFNSLLRLADDDQPGPMLNLLLNGTLLGVATADDLAAVLGDLRRRPGQRRLFLVHCLLGHNLADIRALHRASGSMENHLWLHDYSSVCPGYNLLRNDVAFCGAPPPDSMACRVCVYGAGRAKHLAAVRELLQAVPFHVVAPSPAALQTWQAAGLPYRSARVHPHCDLVPEPGPAPMRDLEAPVRIAFVGYAKSSKGWPIWQALTARCSQSAGYHWLHLGSEDPGASLCGTAHHAVTTTCEQPDAMVAALSRLHVDLVAVLSPWPETFSYTTFEALAAAADVVCLASSGNVADTVLRHRRGVVAQNAESLIDFFASGQAAQYARLARHAGTPRSRLLHGGTTATLPHTLDG